MANYKRSWSLFRDFQVATNRTHLDLPLDGGTIALFVAFLVERGFAPSTIRTHLSALAFSHKVLDLYFPTKNFLVEKMLRTVQSERHSTDLRLPITLPILMDILDQAPLCIQGVYDLLLFKAMCSTAFFAFMRAGEICNSVNTMQAESLFFDPASYFAIVTFFKYKHKNTSVGWPIRITSKAHLRHCPVRLLSHYMQVRGASQGPLFRTEKGLPISRNRFAGQLKTCLRRLPVDHSRFSLHSFRIGAATSAILAGKSHEEIRTLGRWSSDAFKRYIRLSGLVAM